MQAIKEAICIINYKKPQAPILAMQAVDFLSAMGVNFSFPAEGIGYSVHSLSDYEEELKKTKAQIAIIFGGDGTLINTSRVLAPLGIPVLGVNLGTLGFLTGVEPMAMNESLAYLATGDYVLESRMLLQGSLLRNNSVMAEFSAINDIVINNSGIARTIALDCLINGEHSIPYEGDGVVVATPTGSTAYSLSAGGPIVLPQTEVFLITPIAPHNLYARPIVASSETEIRIVYQTRDMKGLVTYDGQGRY
ncbi:MAG: NAD(+)/NADH kinase, partial [Clostridia bacterium]|nr:NAD(+)/NADH kinase [Clostridia bacterium]